MTNHRTISSLVKFYTAEIQNNKNANLTPSLGDSQSGLGMTDAYFLGTSTPLSDPENSSLQYIKSDIQSIVCDVLGVDKTYLYMYGDKELDNNQIPQIDEKVIRYGNGEPLAYILGYKYFWDQKLKVTQDTLIPRADTEVLVQSVLDDLEGESQSELRVTGAYFFGTSTLLSDLDKSCFKLSILDLGTGTGAIALALAGEFPEAKIVAVDYSAKALEVAKENAVNNGISNVEFEQSDWYNNLKNKKFDIIVSNPPYIGNDDGDIDAEVKAYEPISALFAGDNGLADIEIIISQAREYLNPLGSVYIEHGYTQSANVQTIFKNYGFVNVETLQDWNNKDRCTKGNIQAASVK